MSKNLDRLFDPERLRRNWEKPIDEPLEEEVVESEQLQHCQKILAHFESLQQLIESEFGQESDCLTPLFSQAKEFLNYIAEEHQDPEKITPTDWNELQQILTTIEDSIEALQLTKTNL